MMFRYVMFHLHYITLHYITLHYITLHYITLHCDLTEKTNIPQGTNGSLNRVSKVFLFCVYGSLKQVEWINR
jgi:hypothetical protein